MTDYEVSIGTYPGFVIGVRTYKGKNGKVDHVMYLPFIDICISTTKRKDK